MQQLKITWAPEKANHYKSITLVLLAYFLYTMTMSFAKLLQKDLSLVTIVFIRCLFGQLFFLPLVIDKGFEYYKTKQLKLHLLRIALATLSMLFSYYTYTHIPLSLATSIGFISPIFVACFSVLFLKDKISITQWLAILIGYLGILIIIQPIKVILSLGIVTALLSNITASLAVIIIKLLTKTEQQNTIVLYGNSGPLIITGIISLFTWTTPSSKSLLILACMGATALGFQYCLTKAMRLGKPSILAPMEYSRILFALPIGVCFFQETISNWMLVGTAVIILSNYYLITRIKL